MHWGQEQWREEETCTPCTLGMGGGPEGVLAPQPMLCYSLYVSAVRKPSAAVAAAVPTGYV